MVRSLPLFALLLFTACQTRYTLPPGGYPYPEQPDGPDTNFYLYPLRDTLSKLDSFHHVWDEYGFKKFDEPNLSLRPLKIPEFRFYQPGYRSYDDLLIVLTPQNLVVKRHKNEHPQVSIDSNKISPLDRHLVEYMDRHFGRPRPDSVLYPRWYRYDDSMEKRYPQLNDAAFYIKTIKRTLAPNPAFLPCETFTRAITEKEYQTFIDSLNTPDRYHFVSGYPCPNDTNLFYKACEHLARMAGLENEVNILWIEPVDTPHTNHAH